MGMSTLHFSVTEHTIPCQYIREYPHASKSDHAPLRLAIKEYQPLERTSAGSALMTIIATHGNGFPKETYEPLFDELYRALKGKIRGIWFADYSHQGASGILNERLQGDDRAYKVEHNPNARPSQTKKNDTSNWFDHSRDLLCMVNHFRDQMPRPIIGIAHSLGAAQLVHLSLIHPRLFHSLALIEPVIQPSAPPGPNAALPSSLRPDTWPSRSAAEEYFRQGKAYRNWDPRVLDQYLKYGLRDLPNSLVGKSNGPVTLTTTKHQEAWTYARSNFVSTSDRHQARLLAPDLSAESADYLFHRSEMVQTFYNLPNVRPNVLWLFGARSYINGSRASRAEKVASTGTGIGGSGGAETGNVESIIIQDGGHMLPFEHVRQCASTLAPWLAKQVQDFNEVEQFHQGHDSGRSQHGMKLLSKHWLENVTLKTDAKRSEKSRL